jgi:hypothetical protein
MNIASQDKFAINFEINSKSIEPHFLNNLMNVNN